MTSMISLSLAARKSRLRPTSYLYLYVFFLSTNYTRTVIDNIYVSNEAIHQTRSNELSRNIKTTRNNTTSDGQRWMPSGHMGNRMCN